MMWIRSTSIICVVLALGSVCTAATIHWTGLGDDNLWSNPDNWESQKVPTIADEAFIDVPAAALPNGPVIRDGIEARVNGLACEVPGEPNMAMTGGTLEVADWIWWGDGPGSYGTFYMSGGTITVGDEHELGWDNGQGTWIMTGGTVTARRLIVPTGSGAAGQLYLHGGTYNVGSGGLSMTSTGLIDVTEGTLVLEGDQTGQIDGFIAAGQITAYDGTGYFELDYDERASGKTTLTAKPITGKAYAPDPPDGAGNVTSPLLRWKAGLGAAFHDVYLGTTATLGPADLVMRNPAAVTMYWHGPGLVPGATYYWRIDEVEGDMVTIHTGDVWSFTATPKTAHAPTPRDGALWIPTETTLSWLMGAGAQSHDVYFGTDRALVEARDASVFEGNQFGVTLDPGALAENTSYYWVVDEHGPGGVEAGEVWSFTTIGPGGGVKAEYWSNMNLSGAPALVQIEDSINHSWGGGDVIPGYPNGISARWTAELEVAFTETYTFVTRSDDGVRLWVANQLLIDNWTDHGATEDVGRIDLEAGQTYPLVMEWYENGGDAVAQLFWRSASTPREIIPAGPLQVPLKAGNPKPADGATDVRHDPILRWSPGMNTAQQDVFFGTDEQTVADATTAAAGIYKGRQELEDTSYAPGDLAWNTTYYWKINEVNGADVWEGRVWSFTTADCLIVEDFEDYNDFSNRIFQSWTDGFGYTEPPPGHPGNGTNSTVGNFYPPFAETTIVHGGGQALVMDYNNATSPWVSQADRIFETPQDWTVNDIKALSLWYRGLPPSPGGFSYDQATGTYTVTGYGGDIWDTSDQFFFVYKQLNGDGSVVARLDSIENTHDWAKAGVMIRNTLDANSEYAFVCVTPPAGAQNRVAFQYRVTAGTNAQGTSDDTGGHTMPVWLKITRQGNTLTGQQSSDGVTWEDIVETGDPSLPTAIGIPGLSPTVYIGLAVTSHVDATTPCTAEFSNVTTTGGATPGVFTQSADVVPQRSLNANEPMYLVIESGAQTALLTNPDPNALIQTDYKPWHIPLTDISSKGVNLSGITKMTIGVGNKLSPAIGGKGTLYVDDIRVCGSRCVPTKAQPLADFDDNCIVDYSDLETLVGEWLLQAGVDTTLTTDLNADDLIDLADFAVLADEWMLEIIWP